MTAIARIALLSLAAVALLGCGAYMASPVPTIELRTAPPNGIESPQACMMALMQGVLVREERSGIGIVSDGDGTRYQVIWPSGYVAVDGSPPFVLNDTGQRIAKVGDHVALAGGEVAPATWLTCGEITFLP
jgi:hypothetical protein